MDYNILRIDVDRSGRVINSSNLSLNQCSDNNRIHLYYDGDYDYIELSFRKPDGWLSDKVTMTFDVDEDGSKFAYYTIDPEFTSFIMGGRQAVLSANVYLHYTIDRVQKVATAGGIRIGVNYVDDALVNTLYSEAYINNVNAQIGALQNDFNKFKIGDLLVGSAATDRLGNTIDIHYETKSDAESSFKQLDSKKLDKTEFSDQTGKINLLETSISTTNNMVEILSAASNSNSSKISKNENDIQNLLDITVKETDFEKAISDRKNAELNLQKQIDDLSSSSNVFDVVGTRSELDSYDKSKLHIGDKIQVLSDASQNNLPTIYKWTGTGWEYIGKYSSGSYSKVEIDSQHNEIRALIPNKLSTSVNKIILMNGSMPIGVSNVELKTINGKSVLGSGNIEIPVDSLLSTTSENPVQNKVISNALSDKADKSVTDSITRILNTKASQDEVNRKQNKLTAGTNVTITEDGVISVSTAVKFLKVNELPLIGNSTTIYIVYRDDRNAYAEYIWLEDEQRWEMLGVLDININNYYDKATVDSLLNNKVNLTALNALSDKVSANTIAIGAKADKITVDSQISLLNGDINNLNLALNSKPDRTEFENFATKEEIPDVSIYQEKLVNTENIKSINGVTILGSGDLLIADTEIVDLGKYVLAERFEEELSKGLDTKLDKSEAFNKDYNSLTNLPNLDIFLTSDSLTGIENDIEELSKTKQDKLVSGTSIKTINGESLLGSEDISVITSLDGYATETFVSDKFAELIGSAPETLNTIHELADALSGQDSAIDAIETAISKKADLAVVEGVIGDIQNNTKNISTNLSNINIINSKLANIYTKTEADDKFLVDSDLDNIYTKTESDEKFLTSSDTIEKSETILDYRTGAKIRFSSDSSETDFIVSDITNTNLINLLNSMIPNEY